jgi:phosphatidate cytidylyltransferase
MSEANQNLALRIATALVLFPIAVWVTWRGGLPFAAVCAVAAAVTAAELVLMFGGRLGALELAGVAVAGLLPLIAWAGWREGSGFAADWLGVAIPAAAVLLLVLTLFRPGPLEEAPRAAAMVALAWLYCGVLVSSAVALRLRFGFGWVILAFVVSWANDTFAYFGGRFFGRHKLYERISPKKTWEGFAVGALGSLAGALAVKALLLRGVPTGLFLAVAAGGALLGPLGDLAESMLKRAAGVKDSGRIVPGHGGLLDRIDALLFVLPWIYAVAALALPPAGQP